MKRKITKLNLMITLLFSLLLGTSISTPTMSEEKVADQDQKIYMLNLLWFRQGKGVEDYVRYLMRIQPMMPEYGGKPLGAYLPNGEKFGTLIVPDLYGMVSWESKERMEAFFNDPRYISAEKYRDKALERFELIESMSANDTTIPFTLEMIQKVGAEIEAENQ